MSSLTNFLVAVNGSSGKNGEWFGTFTSTILNNTLEQDRQGTQKFLKT